MAAAIFALVIAAAAGYAALGQHGNQVQAGTRSPAPPVRIADPTEGPVPPATGAYLGAWVGPTVYTQANSIAAVQSFQQQIGRRLDIVHTYVKWQAPFPAPSALAFLQQGSTLLISWAGTSTRQIVAGDYDSLIRQRAQEIKRLGKPVFLEWRWEMNRPNLRAQVGPPAQYIAAWKHIRGIFAQQQVHNAAWVWCPTARGFVATDAAAYYPGDSQVDWICADVYPGVGGVKSFAEVAQPFLRWASQRPKPVMIGEFGVPISYGPTERAKWLRAAAKVVHGDPQIKALLYFEANPTGHGPNLSYQLSSDPAALKAFRGLADSRYFNPAGLSAGGS